MKSGIQQHHIPSWFIHWSVFLKNGSASEGSKEVYKMSAQIFLGISQRFTLALTRNISPTVYSSREKGDFFTRTCTNICQQTTAKVTSVMRGYNLSGVTSKEPLHASLMSFWSLFQSESSWNLRYLVNV